MPKPVPPFHRGSWWEFSPLLLSLDCFDGAMEPLRNFFDGNASHNFKLLGLLSARRGAIGMTRPVAGGEANHGAWSGVTLLGVLRDQGFDGTPELDELVLQNLVRPPAVQ